MRALAPWTGRGTFRQEMDRLFDRIFEVGEIDFLALGEWAPRVDVSETKDAVVVKAEVPAMDPKEIQVTLEGPMLTIKGEKRKEKEDKDERYYRMERSYGAFTRPLRVPAPVEPGKVNATFKNGLLVVTMPKASAATGTTIPVKET